MECFLYLQSKQKLIKMKKLIGLRVYCAVFGAGVIQSYREKNEFPITVKFDSGERSSYTVDGRLLMQANPTLSITPYTLENGGFTPLSELNKPKVGDWGYFWDDNWVERKAASFGQLEDIQESDTHPYGVCDLGYQNFSPTPPEFIKDKILQSCK